MAKRAFSVPEVPGSKRVSARPYSHAVIGRYSGLVGAELAEAAWEKDKAATLARAAKDWAFYAADAKRVEGEVRPNYNGYPMPVRDYDIRIAKERLEKTPSAEAYIAARVADHEAYVARLRAVGVAELAVLRWSMSLANAIKAAASFPSCIEVRVVPCVEVIKEAKKAMAV